MEIRERKKGVDGVVKEDQQGRGGGAIRSTKAMRKVGRWRKRRSSSNLKMHDSTTVAFVKAADIRVDACRKYRARNWERSEGESGKRPR